MKGKKSTRSAFLSSLMSLVLCFAMLLGTTFAWFTDTASTAVNKIQAGNLDVQLLDAATNTSIEGQTLRFKTADGRTDNVLWEPGCTYELPAFVVKNNGNLTLKYKIVISGIEGSAKLNEAIVWSMTEVTGTGSSTIEINGGSEVTLAPEATSGAITIKGHMKEEAGNEYQGLSIDGIAITVYATQKDAEFDSFNNSYDAGATYPVEIIPAVESQTLAAVKNAEGNTTEYKYANSDNTFVASVPADAVTGTVAPVVTAKKTDTPANITITAASQDAISYDISISNATLGDTKPATITLNVGKSLNNVVLYHNNTAMTKVDSKAEVDANGEFYYDGTAGTVTFATSSFSPFTIVFDSPVAVAGGVSYYSFADAVKNAKSGETVTVLKDCTVPGKIVFPEGKTLTVDWNGKTITAQGNDQGLWATINGTVTMKGSGYVGDNTHESVGYLFYVNGTLNIEGTATYESGLTVAEMRSESSALKISGGRYIGDQWNNVYWTLNKLDAYRDSAVISVTGGSFYKYDPSNGHTESPDDNFVAPGFCTISETKDNGDMWYTVVKEDPVAKIGDVEYESLEAAIGAANSGDTIVLGARKTINLSNVNISKSNVTVKGSTDTVIKVNQASNNEPSVRADGITFDGVTLDFQNQEYNAIRGTVTYDNCVIRGRIKNYDTSEFKDCIFENNAGNYLAQVYAGNATFTGCTFNGSNRCVFVYTDGSNATASFTDCTFKMTAETPDKSAVMLNTPNGGSSIYTVTITNCTQMGGNDQGTNSSDGPNYDYRGLYGFKHEKGVMVKGTVTVDGSVVYSNLHS